MFEDLKTLIARENLAKLKANQRYEDSNSSQDGSSEEDEELQERRQQFESLMGEDSAVERQPEERQGWSRREQWKQRELMEEKLRLAAQMQQREVDYLRESHQRELASLAAEISKLELQLQRSVKEEGVVSALRRDNRRLAELQEDTDRILQKQTAELTLLRRETQQLRLQLRQHEEKEAKAALQQHSESQLEKRLREEVAELQRQSTA